MAHSRKKAWSALRIKKYALLVGCVLLVCLIAVLIYTFIIVPSKAYKEGISLENAGDYAAAAQRFEASGRYRDSKERVDSCYEALYGANAYNTLKDLSAGSLFKFGSYEQDNDPTNGAESIEWIVLDKNGSELLLISRFGLDCQLYNTQYTSITWDSCSLRKWLNSEFLISAFSEAEIASIRDTIVFADENPDYTTDAGKSTQDKVFLLSVSESRKYFTSDEGRVCIPTKYTLQKDIYMEENLPGCLWWLRTPGDLQHYVSIVSGRGEVQTAGVNLCFDMCAVRPVLWLDLTKYYDEQ